MATNKLTVTIITLNEEKDLPRALESVKNLADEIIVVDSGSTDKTVEIAIKFGAKVFARQFDNYANQKNFAANKATSEWILSLDADEEIPPELRSEIREQIADGGLQLAAYSMPRKNIIFGKFIKYTRWQPELDRHTWLYKKNKGKWVGDVHEEVKVEGRVVALQNPKIHYQYETIHEFLVMMNQYSELDAAERFNNKIRFSYFNLLFQPIYNFFVRYIYRFGFLDGWHGFVLSYLMAMYEFEVWVKVWEKGKERSV
jgi:glycosyltransferase involved in cell wall biosynthesis